MAHFDDVAVAVAVAVSVDVDVNGGSETVRASLKVKKDFQRICEFWLCALCACCMETLQRQTEAINLHIHASHIHKYIHTHAKEREAQQKQQRGLKKNNI